MPDELPCATIVLRSIRNSGCLNLEAQIVLTGAFMRRPKPRDEAGLSVDLGCTPDESFNKPRKCYGVVSLHVGRIRDLGLNVIPNRVDHGNIVGTPYKEDDEVRAEWFASRLAEQARIVRVP
jgi:hypothetical protein